MSAHPLADLDPPEVAASLGRFRVIDVREPFELQGELGRIASVESVPLARLAAASSAWQKDEALVMVCRSGGRSGSAVAALRRLGFTRVHNMSGGMLAWNAARLPIVQD